MNPDNCISMTSATVCSGCFVGYKLSPDLSSCVADTSCNTDSSCVVCSPGSYLSGGKCAVCSSLPSNCASCDSSMSCTKCMDGFYLSGTTCVTCQANCLSCNSATICVRATDGYYIQLGPKTKLSGVLAPCSSPCATCIKTDKFCTSCVSGYTKNGTQCLSQSKVIVQLVVSGMTGSSAIFSETDPKNTQFYKAVKGYSRIKNAICLKLPEVYNASTIDKCAQIIKSSYIGKGSLVYYFSVGGGPYASPA